MTPAELTRIPGDLLPGLLEGWCGPVLSYYPRGNVWDWRPAVWLGSVKDEHGAVCEGPYLGDRKYGTDTENVSFPLNRREARFRVVDYLMAGVRCEGCRGLGERHEVHAPDDIIDHPCPDCNGTGYCIPPHDLCWALDWPGPDLAAWESAVILGVSARRVAAGLGLKQSSSTSSDTRARNDDPSEDLKVHRRLHYNSHWS